MHHRADRLFRLLVRFLPLVAAAGLGLGLAAAAAPAQTADPVPVHGAVTHDGRAFAYRLGAPEERAGHRIQRLTFPSPVTTGAPANDRVPGWFYTPSPAGSGHRPAVICLHILNGDFELTRIFCASLAAAGVPALWFPLPWYGERRGTGPPGWLDRPEGFAAAIAQSVRDIRRAHDLLAGRPEVDPSRIGVSGISLGAVLAATAGGRDARFHRIGLILGGGGLSDILAEAEECRAVRQWLETLTPADQARVRGEIEAHDPLTQAAALRERARAGRVLMINAGRDRVVRPERARALARALDMEASIRWLPELGHYTAMAALPGILEESVAFFAQDLPADCVPSRPAASRGAPSPLERLRRFLRELQSMLFREPAAGRCRFLDLEADLHLGEGPGWRGRVRWLRGSGDRFLLDGQVSDLGRARLGGTPDLWLEARGARVFAGAGAREAPLAHAAPEHRIRLRVVAGALTGITMSAAVLQQMVEVEAVDARTLKLAVAGRGAGRLTFASDGHTPAALELTEGRVRGRITFHLWNPDGVAVPGLFAPDAALPRQEVPAADLARMISAAFNLGMEKLR